MYRKTFSGGSAYSAVHVGTPDSQDKVHLGLDVSALSDAVVDADGFLIPGAVLDRTDASIPDGTADGAGVVVIAVTEVAASNSAADLTAASDRTISVLARGTVQQARVEENLGRALTAAELAALDAGDIILA